jgi:hypothetical protein
MKKHFEKKHSFEYNKKQLTQKLISSVNPPLKYIIQKSNILSICFIKSLGAIAHNVPAVDDVLPAQIRACVARPGLAKCGWSVAWEWSVVE